MRSCYLNAKHKKYDTKHTFTFLDLLEKDAKDLLLDV